MRIDTDEIKAASEKKIISQGGQICDWLPYIEPTSLRDPYQVTARALILNAMVNIHFGAPTRIISDWIAKHDLLDSLSAVEKRILETNESDLGEQDKINLYWYIEALWSFMWAMDLVSELDFTQPIPDNMASMCPNLQENEGPEKFSEVEELRAYDQIYKERDLAYRVMWWARQMSLTGESDPRFDLSRSMERRRALEWIMDAALDWDDVPLDT